MSNTKINFFDRQLLSSDSIKLGEKANVPVKELFISSFDTSFLNLKIFFVVFFIVMALITRHTKFIKENKREFLAETIIYGICGAIPIIFMEMGRVTYNSKESNIMFKIIFMFIMYVFFNIVLEIGGLYAFMFDHEPKEKVKEEKTPESFKKLIVNNITKSTMITVALTVVYFVIILLLLTYKVFNFSVEKYGSSSIMMLNIEAVVFGLCNALPFYLIAKNREGSHFDMLRTTKEVVLIFIKFFIFHFVLQGSGFYAHLGYK